MIPGLGNRIKILRDHFGLTQLELSKQLKCTASVISDYENDAIDPSIDVLVSMAKLFGVTTDYLLGTDTSLSINVETLNKNEYNAILRVNKVLDEILGGGFINIVSR